jgi:DNA sulfur modification protein DndB
MTMAKLIPTDGHLVAGVVLDPNRFSGRMKAAQLFQVAIDPRRTEDPRQLEGNTELENLKKIRMEIQRLFEGAKAKNVEPYARYVVAVHEGQNGMAPPIILFTERHLLTDESETGPGASIQIPWDVQLVAIDGETQLAARFEAANITAETKDNFVPVIICHGRTIDWARQVFHDLNLLAVRPNAALGISMDERDPLTQVARDIEDKVPFFRNRVNKVRRQLRASDKEVVTITALRGACVTFAEGIGGVKYGAKPVPVEKEKLPAITATATEWLDGVTNLIGAAMEDRAHKLAAAPPVLAAIGAMGHTLLARTDHERAQLREDLLRQLKPVQWTKGATWEGVAGKFTPKGKFSVGGTKETAYAVYSALSDSADPAYVKVRTPQPNSLPVSSVAASV